MELMYKKLSSFLHTVTKFHFLTQNYENLNFRAQNWEGQKIKFSRKNRIFYQENSKSEIEFLDKKLSFGHSVY